MRGFGVQANMVRWWTLSAEGSLPGPVEEEVAGYNQQLHAGQEKHEILA